MARSIRLQLDRVATSAALARARVATLIRGSSTAAQREDALLVVSELVTNAVVHGRAPIALEADLGVAALRLQVFDSDSGLSHVAIASLAARGQLGGRGLLFVDALAKRWGVDSVAGGKCVWATIAISGGTAAGDGRPTSSRVNGRFAQWPPRPAI